MVQTKGLEVAGDITVVKVLLVLLTGRGAVPGRPGIGHRVHRIEGCGALEQPQVPGVGVAEVELPVVVEAVVDLGEVLACGGIEVSPVPGQAGMPWQVQVGTIAVAGHRAVGAVFVGLVVAGTEGEHGVVRNVRFKHTVHQRALGGAVVREILAIGVGHHQASTQAAIPAQRAGEVELLAVVVPAAGRQGQLELVVGGRPLAHHVDDAARVARAAIQRRGTAQHLDVVELGQLEDVGRIERAHRGTQRLWRSAVDLQVLDAEAA
ncbi:hypothetical protein D3C80_1080990 [compost metagenome]